MQAIPDQKDQPDRSSRPRRSELLLFIPTYNEKENVPEMVARVDALDLDADLVFLDDASPDGTGELLDRIAAERPDFHVIHRSGKLGIGGAHLRGIEWAYERDYSILVTLDCDFSHSPEDIPRLLERLQGHDLVVASRYLREDSLPGWNLLRRSLTKAGHLLTVGLLGMPYDATGAFRVYDLHRVPKDVWGRVQSRGYSFFFESLFLLTRNGMEVTEESVVLPARTYGSSKMSILEAIRSGLRVWKLWFQTLVHPEQFGVARPITDADSKLVDSQGWDDYWNRQGRRSNQVYSFIAAIYRNLVIRRQLRRILGRHFQTGSELLHAGCGSGQVDIGNGSQYSISAADISLAALDRYQKNNPRAVAIRHADILDLPFPDQEFDGVYNLGVIEHFTESEILLFLREFQRVLKPGGKVVIFWPHARATSVMVLAAAKWVLDRLSEQEARFHPDEISLLRSRQMAVEILEKADLELIDYEFGYRDFFVQAIVVAQAKQDENHPSPGPP